jgi:purine-cytosine permease-like protein
MGYYPAKICSLLNIVIMVGYGMLDCLIGGQVLSAVSGGSMSIIVGIVIVAVISWVITVFGIAAFHHYERWAFLPQIIVLFVLVGSAGPQFDTTSPSVGDKETIAADRLSFFSLCLSAAVAWAGCGSDFYVYYPETTKKWKSFTFTLIGLTLSFSFTYLLGVGLATGIAKNQDWADAYEVSAGALVLQGFSGLGGFGKFCGVIVALGAIANNVPGTYSAALNVQMLGRYAVAVPRWVWSTVIVIIYFVCAVAGRNHLFEIFENFLALMGYWMTIFISIALEEHFIFRNGTNGLGFDWLAWNDKSKLPHGFAALTAFLIGWAGSIVSMDQVYYVGPIAQMVGAYGSDLGIWVGCAFALVVFPPLRWLEIKKIGR